MKKKWTFNYFHIVSKMHLKTVLKEMLNFRSQNTDEQAYPL